MFTAINTLDCSAIEAEEDMIRAVIGNPVDAIMLGWADTMYSTRSPHPHVATCNVVCRDWGTLEKMRRELTQSGFQVTAGGQDMCELTNFETYQRYSLETGAA